MRRQSLSLLLALCMVLSLFTVSAGAAARTQDLGDGYYLIGSHNSWSTVFMTEDDLFQQNPNDSAEFVLETALNVGQEFKVVKVSGGECVTWYPDPGDNYVVDAAHAGPAVIYFRPNYHSDWAANGGYFWVGKPVVSYLDENGQTQSTSVYTVADAAGTSWNANVNNGFILVHADTQIPDRIEVSGDVSLILADGMELTAGTGIHVSAGNSLTVYGQSAGTGLLTADLVDFDRIDDCMDKAAIGSDGSDESNGKIVINGGQIKAIALGGPGIGGGGNADLGEIVINGGVINASDETIEVSAGIGTFWGASQITGSITINGGEIYAYGAVGIGDSANGGVKILITGGVVNASSAEDGDAIGGRVDKRFPPVIEITGGTVNANAGPTGAGLGMGCTDGGASVKISGGIVNARGGSDAGRGYGAGIGYDGQNMLGGAHGADWTPGTVTITGGRVSAEQGGPGAPGIGGMETKISLSWTDEDYDFIYSSSYDGTLTLEKAFEDEETPEDIYGPGVIEDNSELAGVTLVPHNDHEHSYDLDSPVWDWAADYTAATASFTCLTCGEVKVLNADVTSETTPATCESEGKIVYTAKVLFYEEFYTDTQEVVLDALGHNWGEPSYEWNETASGWACTASAICENDASHVLTETVDGAYEVVVQPTTSAPGLGRYTAEFENELFEDQTKDVEIPQLRLISVYYVDKGDHEHLFYYAFGASGESHAWPGEELTAVEKAVCDAETDPNFHNYYKIDLDPAAYSTVIFNDGQSGGGNQTRDLTFAADAGSLDYVVYYGAGNMGVGDSAEDLWPVSSKVTVEPTCTEAGSDTYTGLLTGALQIVVLPATGHAWGEPAYVWSSDNSSVTATVVCANDASHVLTETVQTSYTVTVDPTATEPGTGVYTAEFTDEHFTTQTKEVQIPATNIDARLVLVANLRADEEIVLAFSCSPGALSRYSSYYVELNVTNYLGETRTLRYGPNQENELIQESYNGMPRYFLYYYGIAAKQMGDRYTVRIHAFNAEGTEFFSPLLEGSIRDFLMGHLMNTSNSGNFRRLAADMLDYGAEAQKFFHYDENNLVNVPGDAEEATALDAFRTPDAPVTTNVITQEGSSSYRFTFSLDLENKVVLFVQSTADPSSTGLQIVVTENESGEEVARLDATQNPNLPNKFYANFDKVGASNMRTLYDIVMVDANGNKISKTLSWSVDAYLAQLRAENNETLIPIVSAILVYGDSAGRYLSDPQGNFD